MSNRVPISYSLFELTSAQKWWWVCVLAECSRLNTETLDTSIEYLEKLSGCSKKDIQQAIDILIKNGTLSVECQLPVSKLVEEMSEKCQFSPKRLDKTRLEKSTTFALSHERAMKIYEGFPRKRGKPVGLKRLIKDLRGDEDFALMEKALRNFKEEMSREQRDMKMIPYFSTWAAEWREWINISPLPLPSGQSKGLPKGCGLMNGWEPNPFGDSDEAGRPLKHV